MVGNNDSCTNALKPKMSFFCQNLGASVIPYNRSFDILLTSRDVNFPRPPGMSIRPPLIHDPGWFILACNCSSRSGSEGMMGPDVIKLTGLIVSFSLFLEHHLRYGK